MTLNPTPTVNAGTAAPAASPSAGVPQPLVLWSTNTHLKYRIQQTFAAGVHYVWCSPAFEGATLSRYSLGAGQPPSSDPATIYRTLHQAVRASDAGDPKIVSQKKTLKGLALRWFGDGLIDASARDEMTAMIRYAVPADWRPLIYVIPFEGVRGRATLVPRKDRASQEPEYRICDLVEGEFSIMEPMPC